MRVRLVEIERSPLNIVDRRVDRGQPLVKLRALGGRRRQYLTDDKLELSFSFADDTDPLDTVLTQNVRDLRIAYRGAAKHEQVIVLRKPVAQITRAIKRSIQLVIIER